MAAAEETRLTGQTRTIVPLDVDAEMQRFPAEDMRQTCGLHAQPDDPHRHEPAPPSACEGGGAGSAFLPRESAPAPLRGAAIRDGVQLPGRPVDRRGGRERRTGSRSEPEAVTAMARPSEPRSGL